MKRAWGALIGALLSLAAHAAPFTIYNQDAGTGSGFDDPTVVAPVPGNDAPTLGAQRLKAMRYAAAIVTSRVVSNVPIRIAASFAGNNGGSALACTTNSATLGQGGAAQFTANFSGAPRANTLYPLALANALAGERLGGTADIAMTFNGRLDTGSTNCLQGYHWYYGLDGKPENHELDFVATAVHELIHGLGFQSLVALQSSSSESVGQFPQYLTSPDSRYPDIYSSFIQDLSMAGQPLWPDMTAAERAASITDGPGLVWDDANTDNAAAGYLTAGINQGRVELYAPATIEPGSSISHWALALSPSQIMEPRENPNVGVLSGIGMSACVLENIGWQLANDIRCPDVGSATIAGQSSSNTDGSGTQPTGTTGGSTSGGSSHSGGGGGCTIDPNAAFDPLWAAMIAMALGVLGWRRRQRDTV
ncbi:JDVT-CTERM domain-containing protein [Salinisphaera hydrothermalis]|uniref:JDVT-CTERM domain-containing protein n=1 Tax=Salinisphaera hydrothermalis TaxID=563188 RepID=UPI00333F1AE2